MTPLKRIAALETRHAPAPLPGLLLLLDAAPTARELAEVAEAKSKGRLVLLVRFVGATNLDPDRAGGMQ